jgi:hypothetical protein
MHLDRFISRMNLERYRKLLSATADKAERKVLLSLLAEEEAKYYGASKLTHPG